AASRSASRADGRISSRDAPTVEGLALKLVLTPALIGAVSLAGRRWGPGVSGWLVGFPLTSGPVAFFLALDQGVGFAAAAAVGSMTGAGAQPRWDIPARMRVTTALVLLLTGFATVLGPQLTGLLATFPLYGAILAGFAHHLQGPGPAIRVLRGLLLGLFALAGFFLVLALSIERAGIARAFAAAIATALILQSGALWALRRESPV